MAYGIFDNVLNEAPRASQKNMDRTYNGVTYSQVLKAIYDEVKLTDVTKVDVKRIANTVGWKVGDINFAIKLMAKWNLFDQVSTGNFKINAEGLKELGEAPSKEVEETPDLAVGVRDISKLKEKKFIIPKVSSSSKFVEQMSTILTHMDSFASGLSKTSFMLAGEVGVGKTQNVKALATLTGLPLIVIEAPHITAEHVINIPFLMLDGNKTRNGNITVDDTNDDMKVVQSESNIITQIRNLKPKSEQEVQKYIDRNPTLKKVQSNLEYELGEIKGKYKCILFIDEYFRTTNVKIRNILRNILNGRIGNSKIPEGVYFLFASNINDTGVTDIPLNQDFHMMNYDTASKEDFMSYIYGKYAKADEEGLPTEEIEEDETFTPNMDPHVFNAFYEHMNDEDMGFNDESSDVRVSPRRLEQMMLYINASVPVTSENEIRTLKAYIESSLSNYITGDTSSHLEKYLGILKTILEDTSPEIMKDSDIFENAGKLSSADWRDALEANIVAKIKLGDSMTYIPVVSGAPGIGKTSVATSMAQSLGMGFIHIDIANVNPEDVTGMPIANTSGNEITTRFSEPNLYLTIMKEYESQIKLFKVDGRKYNIILLFDELNRANVATFNGIRKVLLEKEFSDEYKLPSDIIMVGAINPTDAGTTEFSSHTRDILNFIPSSANYSKLIEYIKGIKELKAIDDRLQFPSTDGILTVLNGLVQDFRSNEDTEGNPVSGEQQPFYWDAEGTIFYISGREMTEMVKLAQASMKTEFLGKLKYNHDNVYTEEELEKLIDSALNTTAKAFEFGINNITTKQQLDNTIPKMIVSKIVLSDKFRKAFESIKSKKSVNELSLYDIMSKFNFDEESLEASVLGSYLSYSSISEYGQDIQLIAENFLSSMKGFTLIEKLINLNVRLLKSLDRVNASNQYKDVTKKYFKGLIQGTIQNFDGALQDLIFDEKFDKLIAKMKASYGE